MKVNFHNYQNISISAINIWQHVCISVKLCFLRWLNDVAGYTKMSTDKNGNSQTSAFR